MKIYISEEALVGEIQEKFHSYYPYLKLECYQTPHLRGVDSPDKEKIAPDMPIDKIRMLHSFGWLDISYYRTVAAVEHDFRHHLGLSVQIFYKSGNKWQASATTSNKTLEELNAEGIPTT